jgi:sucrose-6-phosphate hydrolase SacC (GH32 family)
LPFQSYPQRPQLLHFSESHDGDNWSEPQAFLQEVLELHWNTDCRAIDPTFVVDGEELHCFFVGSDGLGTPRRANLLGHAVTRDPNLGNWEVLTKEAPLMGRDRAPDGVENVVVYRDAESWIMLLSEGMENQHLAWARSDDLIHWNPMGPVSMSVQNWCSFRHGAPFVWQEGERFYMILMGEETPDHRSSLGLLLSLDGIHWELLPSVDGFETSIDLNMGNETKD